MQRKEYKLLVENWRKVIREEAGDDFDPNEPSISDSSLDFDLDMAHDDLSSAEDVSSSEDMELDATDRKAHIDRFCKLMGIPHACGELESFINGIPREALISQAFLGDEEGNQFDEEGNIIDFDSMEEM